MSNEPQPNRTVVVVDDDDDLRALVTVLLAEANIEALSAGSVAEALELMGDHPVDLVLTDLVMPEADGFSLLASVRERWPDLPVIMMTAHGTVQSAVEAMKAGAADFVLKPLDREELIFAVEKGIASSLHEELRSTLVGPGKLLGAAPAMQRLYELIQRAARGHATVLLRGESGTGKELAARAIHSEGPRKDGPFVKVHCAALPDNLLESELFGYEKGAFTGAVQRKPGRVDLALGGTLFLDEIGDITPAIQVKLLRLLQDREYERLGGTETLQADVRFLAATHRDLESQVREGTFREDLFYRLHVVPITIPPLRDRKTDVPLLVDHYFKALRETHGLPDLKLEQAAVDALVAHDWPGNVRQLVNVVERIVVLSDGTRITARDVSDNLGSGSITREPTVSDHERLPSGGNLISLSDRRQDAEIEAIERALDRAHGNRTLAARILGVSRRTLYNKLKAHQLERKNG